MQIQTVVKSFSLTSFIHNRKFQRCNVLQKFEKNENLLRFVWKNHSTVIFSPYATCTSPIMHLTSPPPQPPRPQILHNLFSFLLSITADPTEIENNGWAKFVGGGGGE